MRTRSTPKAGTQSFTPPVLNSSTNSGILGPMPTADKSAIKPKWDEKLSALRSARRAKGLCMKCGEPYSPQHKVSQANSITCTRRSIGSSAIGQHH